MSIKNNIINLPKNKLKLFPGDKHGGDKVNFIEFYNTNIIDYFNFIVIKRLLSDKVSYSDFNEMIYNILLYENKTSININEQLEIYQNTMLLKVFEEIFQKQHSEHETQKSSLDDLLKQYDEYIKEEIEKHKYLL